MDPNNSTGFSDFDDETLLAYSNQFSNYIENGSKFTIPSPDLYLLDAPYNPPDPDPGVITTPSSTLSQDFDSFVGSSSVSPDGSLFAPSMGWSPEGGEASSSPSDDGESSDPVLKYISQMLLEEDMDDKPSMFYDPLTLQATEKSLFDVLGEQHRNYSSPNSQLQFYPSPVNGVPESYLNFSSGSIDFNGSSGAFTGTYGGTGSDFVGAHGDAGELNPLLLQSPLPGNHHFQSNSQQPTSRLSGNLSESVTNIGDGSMSSSVNELLAQNIFSDSESILQFNRGMEEASKFLPTSNQLVVDVESYNFSKERKEETSMVAVKVEKDERENSSDWLRGRKNHEREEDLDLEEERSNKQSAVTVEESELSDMFDKVLLICTDSKGQPAMCPAEVPVVAVQTGESNSLQPNGKSNGGKSRGKKQGKKKMETVDLRTLLILCAQAVSTNDCRTANELLKQIRQHSSSTGDGSQRLAHFFANGLEARMAGSGMGILIQLLSMLPDGPPKLRITGIEYPQPGFRPAERIEETGRRLEKYCERFNVPFEFNGIASQNWETIRIEDLKIKTGEVLAVNCLFRFKNLLDETVEVDCPRNAVLGLIRKMKPDIFVNAIVNGAYNAPFFVTRFREALFHFSSLFDMFDTTISRENQERLTFEKEFYGREVINTIASEGLERVERPETYKQWQVRIMRAGFKQLPFDQDLMKKLGTKLKAWYHKDFDSSTSFLEFRIDYQILPGPDRQAWIKFEYVEDYLQRPLPYQHSVQISIQLRYLLDETVVPNSLRDAVLNLFKRINPNVFIHGIINGAYNAPFSMSRFREALFYFSAVFDMFEANAGRGETMLLEEDVYAGKIMNAIARKLKERKGLRGRRHSSSGKFRT
ncbi:hypothetical protein LWI28_021946 [Acer negundo]|uniref:Uncharacterized protein n=1 Tax=Acer negundo TaxID=4023 RepID=A0AAD5P2L7_ACENE|nr:hypothetical protein LWI28_021946 [Acer negundo]